MIEGSLLGRHQRIHPVGVAAFELVLLVEDLERDLDHQTCQQGLPVQIHQSWMQKMVVLGNFVEAVSGMFVVAERTVEVVGRTVAVVVVGKSVAVAAVVVVWPAVLLGHFLG